MDVAVGIQAVAGRIHDERSAVDHDLAFLVVLHLETFRRHLFLGHTAETAPAAKTALRRHSVKAAVLRHIFRSTFRRVALRDFRGLRAFCGLRGFLGFRAFHGFRAFCGLRGFCGLRLFPGIDAVVRGSDVPEAAVDGDRQTLDPFIGGSHGHGAAVQRHRTPGSHGLTFLSIGDSHREGTAVRRDAVLAVKGIVRGGDVDNAVRQDQVVLRVDAFAGGSDGQAAGTVYCKVILDINGGVRLFLLRPGIVLIRNSFCGEGILRAIGKDHRNGLSFDRRNGIGALRGDLHAVQVQRHLLLFIGLQKDLPVQPAGKHIGPALRDLQPSVRKFRAGTADLRTGPGQFHRNCICRNPGSCRLG